MRRILLAALAIPFLPADAGGQEPIALIDGEAPLKGWRFGDGPEFPGAKGRLTPAEETFRDRPVLCLSGDFTAGGNYVQMKIDLPDVAIEAISLWVQAPLGSTRLPIRYRDAQGNVHQIHLKLNDKGGWQHLRLPLNRFLLKRGTPDAPGIVVGYETWDGLADAERHDRRRPTGASLAILASTAMGRLEGTIHVSDILLHSSSETAAIEQTVRLDEMLRLGELDWAFNLGQEFDGARGGLDLVADQPTPGENAMRLHADFRGGGAYVGLRKALTDLNVQTVGAIRLRMRSETTTRFALRLVDGSGQCHQVKGLPLAADGYWHDMTIVPAEIAGGEHWGGANDGQWHDPARLVEFMLNKASHEGQTPDLWMSDIRAEVTVGAELGPIAFDETSSGNGDALADWKLTGDVGPTTPGANDSGGALRMPRPLDRSQTPTSAVSAPFSVGPVLRKVEFAGSAELVSPDNSYRSAVRLKVLDATGRRIEATPLGVLFGEQDWKAESSSIVLPVGAASARFDVRLHKTNGELRLDHLSVTRLSSQPVIDKVQRILLASDAVGNLFYPGDPVRFRVTVETSRPLAAGEQVLWCSVRDDSGAEQTASFETPLEREAEEKDPFLYSADVLLNAERLAVGRFYELHVAAPQEAGDPVSEFSGFAILPEAKSKRYRPEQIPFTIRNWDSRVPAYFDLADRIGLRLIGVWGGWSSQPPYKPQAPGIDRCTAVGARWITGTPAAQIERNGFADYSDESLRIGMRRFLETFADRGLCMIAMGNEPHGAGDKVSENVRAYRTIYESVKAFDPEIHVIGTSVEPNEDYFQAGYQNYLDSYDFHIYEHYTNVRRTMREYRALMEKYDAVRPIHSTELGLNSQGLPRRAVAIEMIKKFTVFFAEGGETAGWFTIQYPDPQGEARGQFGDSHCMFDCKYNLYNPRLDAITQYIMIDSLCDKRFVEERRYPGGIEAYLFRNGAGDSLQILWCDEARRDVSVPVPGRAPVELAYLDGTRTELERVSGGVTVTVGEEPILLLYADPSQAALPETLAPPTLALDLSPQGVFRGDTATLSVSGAGLTADSLHVCGPPLWSVSKTRTATEAVLIHLSVPDPTTAREARVRIRRLEGNGPVGELSASVDVRSH